MGVLTFLVTNKELLASQFVTNSYRNQHAKFEIDRIILTCLDWRNQLTLTNTRTYGGTNPNYRKASLFKMTYSEGMYDNLMQASLILISDVDKIPRENIIICGWVIFVNCQHKTFIICTFFRDVRLFCFLKEACKKYSVLTAERLPQVDPIHKI